MCPSYKAHEARDEPYLNGTTPRYPFVCVFAPVFVLQVIQGKPHILIRRVISTMITGPEVYLVI